MAALRPGARGEIIDAISNIAGLAVDGDVVFARRDLHRDSDRTGHAASPGGRRRHGRFSRHRRRASVQPQRLAHTSAPRHMRLQRPWVVARLCGAMTVTGNATVGTTADVAGDTELQTDLAVTQDAASLATWRSMRT